MHHLIEQRIVILLLSTGVILIEATPTLMMIMMKTNQLSLIRQEGMLFIITTYKYLNVQTEMSGMAPTEL